MCIPDQTPVSPAAIGYAMPSFLLGLYVLYFGGVVLKAFPLFGRQSLGKDGDILDIAWHLVLPVTSLDGDAVGHGALRGKPGPVYARLYEAYQRAKQTQSI